ncbi:hypothetical protein NDK43_05615 [Neobacillus pocheonensis]|uniref:Uncharacterized protein n=1 Tax=Neobacillus pocheonensis TaxID=363869 RepID=A0ABT0W6L3_9BACI|nr:hypothetical protein [Neobacillus pocheonensis]
MELRNLFNFPRISRNGNGTSELANGVQINGKTVYNMYGIGAFDSSVVESCAQFAYNAGWFTTEAAIISGAQFIANGYINARSRYSL